MKTHFINYPFKVIALILLCMTQHAAWAGRPLIVDDAGVNETGAGQIETWIANDGNGNGSSVYYLAPTYSPRDGIEIGALLSRNAAENTNLKGLQLKWRITPDHNDGCNLATSVGIQSNTAESGHTDYANGIVSCAGAAVGKLHFNMGAQRRPISSTKATWGIALEREMGAVTGHVEGFGEGGTQPTWQVGARTDIAKNLQLDSTVGRSPGGPVYSVGLKIQF